MDNVQSKTSWECIASRHNPQSSSVEFSNHEHVSHISTDESGEMESSEKHLRTFTMPPRQASLIEGQYSATPFKSIFLSLPDIVHSLLKCGAYTSNDFESEWAEHDPKKVVCEVGCLGAIARSVFQKNSWNIIATIIGGTIYLDYVSKPRKITRTQTPGQYQGYRFEELCTDGEDTSYNANQKYFLITRKDIDQLRLYTNSEIDCKQDIYDMSGNLVRSVHVELKTRPHHEKKRRKQDRRKNLWLQCSFAGVEQIFIGTKTADGNYLDSTNMCTLHDLRSTIESETTDAVRNSSPTLWLQFLSETLSWMWDVCRQHKRQTILFSFEQENAPERTSDPRMRLSAYRVDSAQGDNLRDKVMKEYLSFEKENSRTENSQRNNRRRKREQY